MDITDNDRTQDPIALMTRVLETDDYVWYADEDNENIRMFSKDENGAITLASDNFFAENALDEACEQVWKGTLTPVYADPSRLSLEEQAKFHGWSRGDSPSMNVKDEADAMRVAAGQLSAQACTALPDPDRSHEI